MQDTTKNTWYVKLKVVEPTYGETYYLSFNRDTLTILSYENDAVLTVVETWADTVTALN